MKKQIVLKIMTVCIFFTMTYCSDNGTKSYEPNPILNLSVADIKLTEADNKFGLKLFKELNKTEGLKNIFISPLSISMALGMTYNGAAGETRSAMHNALEYGELSVQQVNESYKYLSESLIDLDQRVTFNIANSIWSRLDFPIKQEFIDLNQKYFDAEVQELDFNRNDAANIINSWVDDKTKGKIEEIVDNPIDPLTIMFLINAIYFKAKWTMEFNEDDSFNGQFYPTANSPIDCRMMRNTEKFKYFSNEKMQVIELPYGNEDFNMTIFLPNTDVNLDSLIMEIDNDKWNLWTNSLYSQEIQLTMPKFKLEYEKELREILSALGMEKAFSASEADFANINSSANLYISKVKHKTFIQVDEEGTEAAAATSVGINLTSMPSTTVMNINHPFLFAIRENQTGTILFLGKIIEPTFN